jgi:hypothetical protein
LDAVAWVERELAGDLGVEGAEVEVDLGGVNLVTTRSMQSVSLPVDRPADQLCAGTAM